MSRMACVDLPELPLQLLTRRHPEWAGNPVVVVDRDSPQGVVTWADELARSRGVLPGMRYAGALSLASDLHAGVVTDREVAKAVARLTRKLANHTPRVEPGGAEGAGPGVFWLDARGLEPLYASLEAWARGVRDDLVGAGWRAAVVVGFSRFGAYAMSRSPDRARRGVVVLKTPGEESAASRRVTLDRIAVAPHARESLAKLGVTTVGAFLDLPADALGKRFGPDVRRLHRLATGQLDLPLQPAKLETPSIERRDLEYVETNVSRLLEIVKVLLDPLIARAKERGRALAGLDVGLRFERLGDHVESVRPAAPTRDTDRLLELVRLRLGAIRKLPDGVVEVMLVAREVSEAPGQKSLLERSRRDLAAGERAVARVRARFGDESVVRARLREGHLPEGRFAWDPIPAASGELAMSSSASGTGVSSSRAAGRSGAAGSRGRVGGEAPKKGLQAPSPSPTADTGALVRRIHVRPRALPPRPRHEPDGWMLRGLEQGPVVRVAGPYVVSGGWWNDRTVHREYHFAETQDGELLWVYFDRPRRRWFLQGRVE